MPNAARRSIQPGVVADSNLEWQAWGGKDPLFGVIPQPGKERDGARPWTDEEFYGTGRSDWREFRERWERYGLERESCLDIGCGAGRLTRSIAEDFKFVHGVDVAEGMIAYARERVGNNVQLHVTDGITLPLPAVSITAVFSVIVFLHFDRSEHAAAYFREIARVLRQGGTMMIQLPLHAWPSNLKPVVRKAYAATYAGYMGLRRTKAAYHRFRLSRAKWSAFMQSTSYDMDWLDSTLSDIGFRDIETAFFRPRRGGANYSWVFARKA
jgi:ubiquinone/menaquinone biosynthesis C-methylase UbiE